ncbi:hypothetical protein PMW_125 [Pseudomonas phage phiPMW]|uniref:Uncharacterized protein n=1 Tax=Pseudomonas phage phiPMW TaxID=1815582 RepID=A0A1S5R1G1_9CAUD|nr:hypothetical protein FDG97_gp225 [Pseudomonas phage phiPMW]ANA49250.1 hypothetical protein PMW_125 [Pseudomonas phage phiPMW]
MKYEIRVTSIDPLGFSMLNDVIRLAAEGAVLKEGVYPVLSFPYIVTLEIEADEPPVASATVRVFEMESRKEILPPVAEPVKASTFSLGEDPDKVYTREELDAMEWTQVQDIARNKGITGKQRNKVTNAYLALFDKSQ